MPDKPLTPVERMAVRLSVDAHEDEADALFVLDSLMSRICAADPANLTEEALQLQDQLIEVIESWLPPTLYLADRS